MKNILEEVILEFKEAWKVIVVSALMTFSLLAFLGAFGGN